MIFSWEQVYQTHCRINVEPCFHQTHLRAINVVIQHNLRNLQLSCASNPRMRIARSPNLRAALRLLLPPPPSLSLSLSLSLCLCLSLPPSLSLPPLLPPSLPPSRSLARSLSLRLSLPLYHSFEPRQPSKQGRREARGLGAERISTWKSSLLSPAGRPYPPSGRPSRSEHPRARSVTPRPQRASGRPGTQRPLAAASRPDRRARPGRAVPALDWLRPGEFIPFRLFQGYLPFDDDRPDLHPHCGRERRLR